MAYLSQSDDQKRTQQATGYGQPASAAPAGGSSPQAAGAAPRPAGPQGTGYTNLQTYLGLNQAAGQQMANNLAQKSEAAAQTARSAYDKTYSGFQQQVQAGTAGATELRPGEAPATADALAEAQANAQKGYAGPTSWGDAQQQQYAQQAAAAQQQARQLQSQGGLGVGLQAAYGQGGQYSTGARGLDAFLTGAAGGARLKQAGDNYNALASYLGQAGTRGNEAIAEGMGNSQAAQQGWANQAADIQARMAADAAEKARQDAKGEEPGRTVPGRVGFNPRLNQGEVDRPREAGRATYRHYFNVGAP